VASGAASAAGSREAGDPGTSGSADAPDGLLPRGHPRSHRLIASGKSRGFRAAIERVACGFLPGALLGTQIAGLIFFLNPGLPFHPAPVARAFGFYAGLLGGAGLVVLLPWFWRRPRAARRSLPWTLTLALAAAALLDWTHASYYAYYLPTGINERLIKTAIWLSVGGLIGFYTALLHSLDRRRYGWRSRWGFVAIGVLSIYAAIERREAFHPRVEPAPWPAGAELEPRPQLWVVGLDTATLDAILPLAGQGRLPFFARMLAGGAHGRLEPFSPIRPESLWTTLATGKYPWRHGVTGGRVWSADWIAPGAELRLLPVGIGFWRWGVPGSHRRRARLYTREAAALWEILPRLGLPSGVVSWPASTPASREASFALSDRFFTEPFEPAGVWPPGVEARARRYEPDAATVRAELATGLGPAPPAAFVDAVAGDLWRESLSGALLDAHPEVRSLFLVLPGLRHVSRRYFGGYSAVRFEGSQERDAREAAQHIASYYVRLDRYLEEIWSGAQGPRLLVVVSGFGVEGSAGWRRLLGQVSRQVALEGFFSHAPDGVLLLQGEGIQPGALLTGARLIDVVPTLMYALGLPVARDLDGHVLTNAFDKRFLARHPLEFVPTYEGLTPRPAAAGKSSGRMQVTAKE
jgi:hypothetical protein